MNLENWDRWFGLIANIGVVVGLVFLAIEIRANTASNRITLTAQFSSNWVQANGDVATNRDLALVIQKALANSNLDDVEITQLHYFIRQRMAQASMMRRLYIEGFATSEDVRRAYTGLRRYADYEVFRREYKNIMSERNQRMVFEDDGVTWWLDAADRGEAFD
jgi:Zn-dependent M32 family carboxypeptidase